MQNRQTSEGRIFAQRMARELSCEDVDAVAGGHGDCTFTRCFDTHIDDAHGDCDIP